MSRINEALTEATERLSHSNIHSSTARLDAEVLLCHVLDKPRSYLFTWPEKQLNSTELENYEALITLREKGTPVAYLTGERDFWSLKLKVNSHTLIPRPDTELLVELALEKELPGNASVVDLGTGTGAIALAMACERPGWSVFAVDRFAEVIETAQENADSNQIKNVEFLLGSWCSPLPEQRFDMIVSNPPYIRDNDEHLQQGDVRFEPITALASGADGLDDIRLISRETVERLKPGGWLLLEHGYDQGEAIRNILSQNGFESISTEQDLAGHDRVTLGKKPV